MTKYYYSDGTIEACYDQSLEYYFIHPHDGRNANKILHRVDGPAIIRDSGAEIWYQYGLLHREDGPAYTTPDIAKEWYQYGKRHRLDGPAIEYANGAFSWHIDGRIYTRRAHRNHPIVIAYEINKIFKNLLSNK